MDLGGFALAVLLIELTPGPNMAWLVTLTLSQGRRAGLGAVQRTPFLKRFFMDQARGEAGDLPRLLAGMEV
ncbi:MAG: hypothetical protein HC788_06405 [Sphingopyxis sp.]|nr:hypothetical protein [Sphingopyxis sp.]